MPLFMDLIRADAESSRRAELNSKVGSSSYDLVKTKIGWNTMIDGLKRQSFGSNLE